MTSQRPQPITLGFHTRLEGGRYTESDLLLYQDILAEKENQIGFEIKQKIAQHEKWNIGYIDLTKLPITLPLRQNIKDGSFRAAMTEYLPTPPESVSSSTSSVDSNFQHFASHQEDDRVPVRYSSPPIDASYRQPSFRRRIGRGGRLLIDRRGLYVRPDEELSARVADRFSYDKDDDDEPVESETFTVDPYDIHHMRYRALQASSVVQGHQVSRDQAVEVESIEERRRRLGISQRARIDGTRRG